MVPGNADILPAPKQAGRPRSQVCPPNGEHIRRPGQLQHLTSTRTPGERAGPGPAKPPYGGVWRGFAAPHPPISRAEGAHQRLQMQQNLVLSSPWQRSNRPDTTPARVDTSMQPCYNRSKEAGMNLPPKAHALYAPECMKTPNSGPHNTHTNNLPQRLYLLIPSNQYQPRGKPR